MKRGTLAVTMLWCVAVLAVAGCGKGEKAPQATAPPRVTGVTMMTVAAESAPNFLEVVGTVRARNGATIAARIPGTVSSLHVREGERVGKGKLLLTIDAAESTAGAAGAAALVEEAKRGMDEAVARKRLADATFERYQRLFKEEAVTKQEFETRLMEKDVASQGVARAEARLAQAREGARAATAVAGYTRITAPLSGIVTSRKAELGMTVFPGTPLVTVEEEGSYRLELDAPESLMGKVHPGGSVRVTIEGMAATEGRIAEVVPSVDPASRTFTVKVDLKGKGVRSGMYGRAQLPVGTVQGMFVPKGAVVERGSLTSVWAVDRENTARLRLVKTGRAVGERVEILAGLSPGERVVTAGGEKIVDGAKIELKP